MTMDRHAYPPYQFTECKMCFRLLFSDPRGVTFTTLRATNRCKRRLKRHFFFCKKRSTAFHKAVLPTFTKQLRKNYTIITLD